MVWIARRLSDKVKEKLYKYMVSELGYDSDTASGVLSLIERIAREHGIPVGALVSNRDSAIRTFTELYMLDSGRGFVSTSSLNTWSFNYGREVLAKQRDPHYVAEKALEILSKLDLKVGLPTEDELLRDYEVLSRHLSPSVSVRAKIALVLWVKYGVPQKAVCNALRISCVTLRKYRDVARSVFKK